MRQLLVRGLLCFVSACLLAGCGKHKPVMAVGPNDDISVFTNTAPDGQVMQELRRLLVYPVDVVGEEDSFRLDPVPYSRFDVHRTVKNQAFAVDLSAGDDLAKALPRVLESATPDHYRAHKPYLSVVRDVWATGQTTLFAVAWSQEDLVRLLADCDSTALRRMIEDGVVAGLETTMYALGEERALPAQVAREYGWTLRLPKGFFAADDAAGKMVKFNSEDPVRLVLVHWEDKEIPLVPAAWDSTMSRILRVYNDGDFFMPDRTTAEADTFENAPALRWEGIWQNEKYTIGGPFRALAFHRGDRSFLLIGQVFAPGESKVPVLRQVEAILNTFRVVE